MEFFKFFSWTALWAWILSDAAIRYVMPLFRGFYNTLDEMSKSRNGKILAFAVELVVAAFWAYALISWSVWCILRCVLYTQNNPEANRWVFYIAGFLCCEIPLGNVAKASPHRNFLSVLPYVMAMGAYLVFSLNYEPIRTAFPWLMGFVGVKL